MTQKYHTTPVAYGPVAVALPDDVILVVVVVLHDEGETVPSVLGRSLPLAPETAGALAADTDGGLEKGKDWPF